MHRVDVARGDRIARIRSRRTFAELRRNGRRTRSGPVSVTFWPRSSWPAPQLAFAIGKRVGNAVTRNRLRRRLRHLCTESRTLMQPGAYLVTVAPGATRLSFDELRKAMTQSLRAATSGRDAESATGQMAAGR